MQRIDAVDRGDRIGVSIASGVSSIAISRLCSLR